MSVTFSGGGVTISGGGWTLTAAPPPSGQQAYTTSGTYSWTAPVGVTSVSVVAVGGGSGGYWSTNGGGGGGGGGLGYKNNISVTPGQSYTVVVGAGSAAAGANTSNGGDSYFIDTSTVAGLGAGGASRLVGGAGGTYVGDGGGNGGSGGNPGGVNSYGGGGGGAAGYSGNGGTGSATSNIAGTSGTGGAGGGGSATGGTGYGSGGGAGILGQGSNGAGGSIGDTTASAGQPGSNGSVGILGSGGLYGGGGVGSDATLIVGRGNGADGAVRIIWGTNRAFPSINTNDYPYTNTTYSVLIDGSPNYLQIANSTNNQMGAGNWTAEAWIYITSYTLLNSVISKGTGGTATDWFFGTRATTGNLYFGINATDYFAATGPVVSLNTWHHVALVRSGTTISTYLDGVLGNTQAGITQTFNSTGAINIGRGRDASSNYLSGYISNARLVKGVAVYTGTFTVPTSPLQATQGSGTNIAAITGVQTSLLTCQSTTIIDNSTFAASITVNGTVTVSSVITPF